MSDDTRRPMPPATARHNPYGIRIGGKAVPCLPGSDWSIGTGAPAGALVVAHLASPFPGYPDGIAITLAPEHAEQLAESLRKQAGLARLKRPAGSS